MQNKKFKAVEYRRNADNTVDLWIYGVISDMKWCDEDVTASCIIKALNQIGDVDSLTVRINSIGGDVFEGMAIYNTLLNYGKPVNIIGEGIVASIATVIAMAGSTFALSETSVFMLHNPMAFIFGAFNKHEMAKMSDELDKIRDIMNTAYTNKTGLSEQEIIDLLDGDDGQGTYLTPQEAFNYGFCDSVIQSNVKAVAMASAQFHSRGKTIRMEIPNIIPKTNGGMQMANKKAKWLNPKGQTRPKNASRQRPRAEMYKLTCPYCDCKLDFDDETKIVTIDPYENATVAVPENYDYQARTKAKFVNELYDVECPNCHKEFEYDTDPVAGAVIPNDDDNGYDPYNPVPQARAKAKARVKASRKAKPAATTRKRFRAESYEIPLTCTECGEEFNIDVDATMEEAVVTCPACEAELDVDVSNVTQDGDEPAYVEPYEGPEEDEEVYEARMQGIRAERRRMTILDERARAFPQFANAIDQFKKNGSSIETVNNWIFKAMESSPTQQAGNPAYLNAAKRDASKLNSIRHLNPQNPLNAEDDAFINELNKRKGGRR
jgi:ATP-dependent protease ClpP protease subunit/transcription elongation factor Elf1